MLDRFRNIREKIDYTAWKTSHSKAEELILDAAKKEREGNPTYVYLFLMAARFEEQAYIQTPPSDIGNRVRITVGAANCFLKGGDDVRAERFSASALSQMDSSNIEFEYAREQAIRINLAAKRNLVQRIK